MYPRLAPTCEWDTAAAQAIVEEAGGTVIQAGRCDSKGKLLEDWQARGGGRGGERQGDRSGMEQPPARKRACPPSTPALPQAALARGEPVAYNKPDPLNPFFVVYGRR